MTGTTPAAGETLSAILDHDGSSRPALIVPDDGQVLSYGQLASNVAQLAGGLAAAGARRGDRVAFTLPNGPDVIQILLAVTALGAAAAPLNPAYTATEYEFYLTDIAPRLLLMPASRPAAAVAAASACSVPVLGVRTGEAGPPALLDGDTAVTPGQRVRAGQARRTPRVVLHTSGTTTRPKQVPLRQRNLMASARTIAEHLPAAAGRTCRSA